MRDVMFRGKAIVTGEWLYGSLINNAFFRSNDGAPVPYILDTDKMDYDNFVDIGEQLDEYEVVSASVSQYTGLKDKNGKEIYEGDVLNHTNHNSHLEVSWQEIWPGFYYQYIGTEQFHKLTIGAARHFKVIGNINENPELLEGATNGSS